MTDELPADPFKPQEGRSKHLQDAALVLKQLMAMTPEEAVDAVVELEEPDLLRLAMLLVVVLHPGAPVTLTSYGVEFGSWQPPDET